MLLKLLDQHSLEHFFSRLTSLSYSAGTIQHYTSCICERIWEKGPYRAKTKLKIRVDTPVRVNPVKKVFFVV